MISNPFKSILLAATLVAAASPAMSAGPSSVGVITFADADTMFVADWRQGRVHAIKLPAAASRAAVPFNVHDLDGRLARAARVDQGRLKIEDMAVRPGTELVYVSVSIRQAKGASAPAIFAVNSDGQVTRVDLSKPVQSADLLRIPAAEQRFWRDMPAATLTVTDMVFHQGRLYVAGLSDQSFSSALRVLDYPFTTTQTMTSVEMYHPVHDQVETRAPIRTMTIATLNGEPTLVAAYTCTPLVTVALKDLKDGAHVVGKTVAELGWGSAPIDLVSFRLGEADYALLLNSSKSADLMPIEAIAEGARQPGIVKPITWPTQPLSGVKAISVPLTGSFQIDNQNVSHLVALRRDGASGAVQLVSLPKGAYLRLSDFVNEYDFASFNYREGDPFRPYHRVWRAEEGFPELVR
jgi:hypothetical protein